MGLCCGSCDNQVSIQHKVFYFTEQIIDIIGLTYDPIEEIDSLVDYKFSDPLPIKPNAN